MKKARSTTSRSARKSADQTASWPTGVVRTSQAQARLQPRDGGVALYLDDTESSFLDLADPTHLDFEYQQHFDLLLGISHPEPAAVRAVHLGAGACALARAWDTTRPGSTQLAVDFDEKLTVLVRQWFDLPGRPQLRIRAADARDALVSLHPGSRDVIVRDVFAQARTPAHLMTVEFVAEVSARLRDGGIYLVNIGARGPLTTARAEVAALQQVFPHVLLVTDPKVARGVRVGNIVAAASHQPLDQTEVDRQLRRLPLPARLISAQKFAAGSPPRHDPPEAAAPITPAAPAAPTAPAAVEQAVFGAGAE